MNPKRLSAPPLAVAAIAAWAPLAWATEGPHINEDALRAAIRGGHRAGPARGRRGRARGGRRTRRRARGRGAGAPAPGRPLRRQLGRAGLRPSRRRRLDAHHPPRLRAGGRRLPVLRRRRGPPPGQRLPRAGPDDRHRGHADVRGLPRRRVPRPRHRPPTRIGGRARRSRTSRSRRTGSTPAATSTRSKRARSAPATSSIRCGRKTPRRRMCGTGGPQRRALRSHGTRH